MNLADAVQLEQTRGLFLPPGGRPLLLGGAGSETGFAGVDDSSVGGTLTGGCSECGSNAEVDSGAGADPVAGVVKTGSFNLCWKGLSIISRLICWKKPLVVYLKKRLMI